MSNGREVDVARRAKVIEWLKLEIMDSTAQLFRGLWEGRQGKIIDGLSSLIVTSYLLARRLGVSYQELDDAILQKVRTNKENRHQLEEWDGDLSSLEHHLDGR